MSMTEAQEAYLRLVGLSGRWNEFDGPAIEAALRARRELWRAALLTSEVVVMPRSRGFLGIGGIEYRLRDRIDLVVLRDLPGGGVSLSTLFLLAAPGQQDALHALASGWRADEVGWVAQDEAFEAIAESPQNDRRYAADPTRVILRLWWD
jgi:hypothetical protein